MNEASPINPMVAASGRQVAAAHARPASDVPATGPVRTGGAAVGSAIGTPVLEVVHLEKVYGARGNVTRALEDVSFTVSRGEFVGIMGASGSGKSTLLNCVSTIDSATSGSVVVNGADVTRMKAAKLAKFRREQLGFIFQDSNLLDTLTARENIALPLTIARVPAREVSVRVEDVAMRLNISAVLDKYPYQMSGGQQQRVAAARALVTDPALIMADEPTGALDSKNARLLLESFETMNRQYQATVLMVTHDSFAASYTNRVLFIRDGKIFTELRRGDSPRRAFFDRIMEVVAMMGGEGSDAL
ncbi:ABC transporter ATP-binding protein [Collinsella phocaeensis]|uniref:ABC transporter ATP-binding protein n=1 Tax=Collinsella phocaeensis TaxID=1871016 RepID=UPI000B1E6B45|nr:ABC transporter ATP-binding protein [Collinsella phocaeensis]